MERDSTKNYMDQKSLAMNKDFDPIAGVNTMVWDENHDFLRDLQT